MHNIRFLVGDYAEKRKFLRQGSSYSYADNDEVDGVIRLSGKDYFFVSAHPFGDFTALQYLSYCRSLIEFSPLTKSEMADICATLGVKFSPGKKLKRFSIIERRLISLIVNYKKGHDLRINLDGYSYTRSKKAKLKRILTRLAKLGEVTVSVSDTRFALKGALIQCIKCGYAYSAAAPIRARVASRREVFCKLKEMKSTLIIPKAKEIVCCCPA